MEYIFLVLLWVAWCIIHSGMISISVNNYVKDLFGAFYKYYRVIYNIIATLTLIPLYFYGLSIKGSIVFTWDHNFLILRWALLLFAFVFFAAGALKYDLLQFIGLRQLFSGDSHLSLSKSDSFDTSGILNVTRHPWYFAVLLLLWSWHKQMHQSDIVVSSVLSLYVIIGTILEERKLIAEYEDVYRSYMKRVSMLFPTKWLLSLVGLFTPQKNG